MNLKHMFTTLVLAGILLSLALTGCSDSASASAPPQQVVQEFYRWHMSYPGNPLVDRAYRDSDYLADSFVQEVDELLDSFDKGGFDPFLLAQDLPQEITVEDALISGDAATVVTYQQYAGNPDLREIQVELTFVDDVWKITGMIDPNVAGSRPAMAPAQVVESFYGWYLAYIGDPASETFRNPMVDRAYRGHELLTDRFVQQVDELLDSFEHGGYDPFLCAQDIPQALTAQEIALDGGTVEVEVTTSFAGHSFRLDLIDQDGTWKIDDIRCRFRSAQ